MNYFPGLGGLLNDLGDVVSGVIDMDPEELEILKKTLNTNAEALEKGDFRDVSLTESAFGGSPTASALGKHHQLAHTIVADTIVGVTADLRGFRQGVVEFERGMEGADATAAGDLKSKEAAVDALAEASTYSRGDHLNHESRSENLPAEGADK